MRQRIEACDNAQIGDDGRGGAEAESGLSGPNGIFQIVFHRALFYRKASRPQRINSSINGGTNAARYGSWALSISLLKSDGVLVSKVIGWPVAGCLKEIDFA